MSSQAINYDLTVCDRILNLLKTSEMGSRFEQFYYGDPLEIPTDHMPCIIVELQNTNIVQGPTGMDFITQEILIKLVINRLEYMDIQGDNEISGARALEEMAQGLDPNSSQYDTNTVAGIIRNNFTLVNFATNQTMQIRYGLMARKENATGEAHIKFIVENLQLTPNKQ